MPISAEAKAAQATVNKKFGPGTLVIASEIVEPPKLTTGSLAVDVALGGGLPGNQWTEIVGGESSSKSSLALICIAANQRKNPDFMTLWVASEKYNTEWAAKIGVDNSRIHLATTNQMEKAYQILVDGAESRAYDLLVLDSYPALIATEEEDKTMQDMVVGLGARRTGQFFRKVGSSMGRSLVEVERPTYGIFINQWRKKIGNIAPRANPNTTPGGEAKNYAFYLRLELARTEYFDEPIAGKNMKRRVGQRVKVKVFKNKQAAPHRVANYDFYFERSHGFRPGEHDHVGELVTLGVLYDVIERGGGGWCTIGDQRFRSVDKVADALREDLGMQEELERQIRERVFGENGGTLSEEPYEGFPEDYEGSDEEEELIAA